MPVGKNPRLEDVLWAGETKPRATCTGDPGDSFPKTRSAKAATKSSPASAPGFQRSKTLPTVLPGVAPKSSGIVSVLIAKHREATIARAEKLKEERDEANKCAERRAKAVDQYQTQENEAAIKTIEKLETMLSETETRLDELQRASDKSLKDLEAQQKVGGESNETVKKLNEAIALLTLEKKSVEGEYKTFRTKRDAEVDVAEKLKQNALRSQKAECEAAAALALAASSEAAAAAEKKLNESIDRNKILLEGEQENQTAMTKLEEQKREEAVKFHEAAKAACDALEGYTKKVQG